MGNELPEIPSILFKRWTVILKTKQLQVSKAITKGSSLFAFKIDPFDLIFVYSACYESKFIEQGERVGDVASQLLKSLPFPTKRPLDLHGKPIDHICVRQFFQLCVMFHYKITLDLWESCKNSRVPAFPSPPSPLSTSSVTIVQ